MEFEFGPVTRAEKAEAENKSLREAVSLLEDELMRAVRERNAANLEVELLKARLLTTKARAAA